MNVIYLLADMPRLFVVFRTFDRIWDSALYTREFSPLELDTSLGDVNFIFQTDHIAAIPTKPGDKLPLPYDDTFYLNPHSKHVPVFLGQQSVSLLFKGSNGKSRCCNPHSVISCTGNQVIKGDIQKPPDCIYFVLPKNRCTIVVDAHVASCMNYEYHRSKTFRRRLCRTIRKSSGFRHCAPEYEKWTQKERDAWDNYLSIPYMLDVVAVWPQQKFDDAWSYRILSLLHKHVTLEESLAWLSTLGGAHSSLGETFMQHAERAGEISLHQLKLARELGNEVMIARCYLYWAWSLLQRDYLTKCKICILNTWKYVQKIKGSDKVLTNMCCAVWNRLQYKKSLLCKSGIRCSPYDGNQSNTDGSGCGGAQLIGKKDFHSHYDKTLQSSRLKMQSVKVC